MKRETILAQYRAWLTHREYSPATIQKYTHALARFFADTGAGESPARETVAAWRDALSAKGYTPATVNAMLAAVNDYQESIGNPLGKARPLKKQRRVYCDADRELTRAEYFRLLNAARAAGNKRSQLLLETICSTGIRVSELQFITAEAVRRRRASIRCKGKCREILLPAELCRRLQKWCQKRRIHTGPVFLSRQGKPLCRVTVWKLLKALCARANVARKKVFPHNLRHLFARTFYNVEKISRSWRTCSVTPASRQRAFISWNPAQNTNACSIRCTFCCEFDESTVLFPFLTQINSQKGTGDVFSRLFRVGK